MVRGSLPVRVGQRRESEEPLLDACVARLGDAAWVYASDYPHWDSDFPGTVEECRRMAEPLGSEVTDNVLGANAARFYGLDTASA